LPFDDDQTTADFFFKSFRMFRQTMTEPNIWGAFQEAGFEFDMTTGRIASHLMRESAETRVDFDKYGRATSPSKTCRQDGKIRGLVGLVAMSKNQ
jgi:hypothetical protein